MSTGVGLRIKNKRKSLGWSQEELAARMNLKSKSTICKIERGEDNLTTDNVQKYADALGCTPAYLMGWEDENGNETAHGRIINAYVSQSKQIELYEAYKGLTPEKQLMLEAYIRFLQSES